jgi:hypothetical protein
VHERIGLSVIALDEAEALHRVEELDRAGRLLAGQLTLRRTATIATRAASGALGPRAAIFHCHWLAIDLEVGRRDAPATIDQREAQRLTFGQTGQAGLLDRADMNEHVFAAIVTNDEAETLLSVEEFDDARAFANDLGGHAAASAATATEAATTAAAAIATATAAAAATVAAATAAAIAAAATESVAAAEAAAITAAEAAATTEIVAAETIALVAATSATIAAATFIETHALFVFPARPYVTCRQPARRTKNARIRTPNRSRHRVGLAYYPQVCE